MKTPTKPVMTCVLSMFLLASISGCLGGSGENTSPASPPPADESDEAKQEETDTGDEGPPEGKDVSFEIKVTGLFPYLLSSPGFDPDRIQVGWGDKVTIVLVNEDIYFHDWTLDGVSGATTGVVDGQSTAEVTFTAPEPGEYEFYCSVENHRGLGQTGTLTVNAP